MTTAAAPLEVRYLGDLERVELRPGDRFVLTIKGGPLEARQVAMVEAAWAAFWDGAPPRLLILQEGWTLAAGAVGGVE